MYFALALLKGEAQSSHTLQAASERNYPRLITCDANSSNQPIVYGTIASCSLQQYV